MWGCSDVGLRGDLITVYRYLICGNQMDRARLFSVMCSDRTRGSGHKVEHRKFHQNMGKNFFNIDLQRMEEAAQRVCGVFFSGDIPNPTGQCNLL